ncbi:MAG: UDP-N-acetylmuramoyl-tripeptide--D-alanyl-D-alanine ligase [Deltaproteobacteria bacterium]|nr:UDP-N-acetylmuramoyl-tripeptide--D-alanyl-D-alanine ligase [Deltaproteobacteria bacterium]
MTGQKTPVLTGEQVVKATGGVLLNGELVKRFHGITTDTRQTVEGNLFIALRGENFNGHDFLGTAVTGGAAGLVIENNERDKLPRAGLNDVNVIGVNDTLRALGDMAHFWRGQFKIPVLAITGSTGKTTTKEMTAAICGLVKNVIKTEGNFNNLIGLPLTLLRMNKTHEVAVLELGTNRPGEIGRLTRVAAPTVGLITNIGPAHLEGLKSIDCVREEKGDLFKYLPEGGVAVINLDDRNAKILGDAWKGEKVTFGFQSAADVRAQNIKKLGIDGTRFDLMIGTAAENVVLSQAGEHQISNALAAAAAARALGLDPSVICRGLSSFIMPAGRMEIHRLRGGRFLINDAYNANPMSVREAVKTLDDLKGGHAGIVILGDMLELGEQAEALHEEIGSFIANHHPEALFLKGDFARHTAAGAYKSGLSESQVFFLKAPQDILDYLKAQPKEGAWILVKGSRKMKMDEIVQKISETFGLAN